MDDWYIDNWGEIKPKKNLSDWSDFEPWQYWKTQFEWIDCNSEIAKHDVIAFRDDVITGHRDGSRTFKDGVRFNICRVANIKDGKVYLEVIHSEGEEAYNNEEHIYRSMKWLSRYGVQRWPREHSPTERVPLEQKEKGDKIKQDREAKKTGQSSGGGGGAYSSAFNAKQKNKKKSQSRFYSPPPKGTDRPLKP